MSINIVDEILNTGATDNKIKYTITPDNGEPFTATIELATPVVRAGTPFNKALADEANEFIMKSNNAVSYTTTARSSSPTGDFTEQTTFTTNGRRYLFVTTSSRLAIFDCQNNTFLFNGYFGRYPDDVDNPYQIMSSSANLFENGTSTLTLTISFNKQTKVATATFKTHIGNNNVPARTVRFVELGGFAL